MNANDIATIIPSIIAVVGVVYAMARFVSKVDRNTDATERLTEAFGKHTETTTATLADHETRITVLEVKSDSTKPGRP